MSASTNGPHITSGVPSEVAPKRGALNNDRPLHYVDVNIGQELKDCTAILYVSTTDFLVNSKLTNHSRYW